MGRHLAGDAHQRDRIHHRVGEPGDCVGRAGAGRDEQDADLAGRARIALGGVGRALLVAHEDVADLFLVEDRVIDRQHRAAGIAEDDIDALILQRFDDHFRAGHMSGHNTITPISSDIWNLRQQKRASKAPGHALANGDRCYACPLSSAKDTIRIATVSRPIPLDVGHYLSGGAPSRAGGASDTVALRAAHDPQIHQSGRFEHRLRAARRRRRVALHPRPRLSLRPAGLRGGGATPR